MIVLLLACVVGADTVFERVPLGTVTKPRGRAVATADFNNDGEPDVVVAQSQAVPWLHLFLNSVENGEGMLVFADSYGHGSVPDPSDLAVGDVDGDGDVDIVATVTFTSPNSREIVLFNNTDGEGTFEQYQVTAALPGIPRAITMLDADADGDPDVFVGIITGSEHLIMLENTGGGNFSSSYVVITTTSNPPIQTVEGADMDGNGWPDLVFGSSGDGSTAKVAWVPNMGGTFLSPIAVVNNVSLGFWDVAVGDVDGDGDLDIAAAVYGSGGAFSQISWFENDVGNGTSWTSHVVTTAVAFPRKVAVRDMDRDGTLDIVSTSKNDGKIAVYANKDGHGSFPSQSVLFNDTISVAVGPLAIADVNRDGVLDPIYVHESSNVRPFYWLRYIPPPGREGSLTFPDAVNNTLLLNANTTALISFPEPGVNRSYAAAILHAKFDIELRSGQQTSIPFTSTILPESHPAVTPSSPFVVQLQFGVTDPSAHTLVVVLGGENVQNSPAVVQVDFPCRPGEVKTPLVGCSRCPSNTFTETGAACIACPARTLSSVSSSSFTDCVCFPGEWIGPLPREPGRGCQACPSGGICPGGSADPVAAPGFYPSPAGPFQFEACRRAGCAGNGTCATGYDPSFLCSTCAPGYYSRSPESCTECPRSSDAYFGLLMAALFLAIVGSAVFVAWSATAMAALVGSEDHISDFRARAMPASLAMIVTSFQLLGIAGELDFAWGSTSSSIMNVFDVFNISTQALGSECTLESFHSAYVLSLLLPLGGIGAVIACLLVAKLAARFVDALAHIGRLSFRSVVDTVLFTLAPLLYIPITRSTFVLFDCVSLSNGDRVIDSDNGVACYDSDWWAVFPLALASTVVYVIGLPVYFGWALSVRSHKLFEPMTTARFGALYRNWRRAFYWGEVAGLFKRLTIVVATTFLSRQQASLVLVVVAILISWLVTVARFQPYYFAPYNGMDTRLNAAVIGFFLIGAASYSERNSSDSDTFFLVLLILALIALVVIALHALVIDLISLVSEYKDGVAITSLRRDVLSKAIVREMQDVEASPALADAADGFLNSFGGAGSDACPSVRNSLSLGQIELDTLADV